MTMVAIIIIVLAVLALLSHHIGYCQGQRDGSRETLRRYTAFYDQQGTGRHR